MLLKSKLMYELKGSSLMWFYATTPRYGSVLSRLKILKFMQYFSILLLGGKTNSARRKLNILDDMTKKTQQSNASIFIAKELFDVRLEKNSDLYDRLDTDANIVCEPQFELELLKIQEEHKSVTKVIEKQEVDGRLLRTVNDSENTEDCFSTIVRARGRRATHSKYRIIKPAFLPYHQ